MAKTNEETPTPRSVRDREERVTRARKAREPHRDTAPHTGRGPGGMAAHEASERAQGSGPALAAKPGDRERPIVHPASDEEAGDEGAGDEGAEEAGDETAEDDAARGRDAT